MAFKKKKKEIQTSLEPDTDFGPAPVKEKPEPVAELSPARTRHTVSLDKRPLSKKQKKHVEDLWGPDKRSGQIDSYIGNLQADAGRKFGSDKVMAGNDTSNLLIGIPCPSLAFEYLLAQDVFPLGIVMHLAGPPATNKSALSFEIMRWFIEAGGVCNLFEVESKLSPDWMPSIIGYETVKRVIIDFCDSTEAWQQHLLFWLNSHKQKMAGTAEAPGPGRTIPVLMVVDSIMGKLALETQEKVNEKGHGGRSHPVEALEITQWIKTVPHQFNTWPFTVLLLNHLKTGSDDQGREVKRTGGGAGTNFQESFEIWTGVRRSSIHCAEWDGKIISLTCTKNSFGPTGRSIDIRVLWWDEEDPEHPEMSQQKTIFDWHWATVKLLVDLKGRESAELKKVFHIKAPQRSDVENTAWSATLGMKAEDAVSWSEMGRMISENAEVCDSIRKALGIKRRPLLAGDFGQQLHGMGNTTR